MLSAGIRNRPIDYGPSGHALLDPLDFGNLTAKDFPAKYRLEATEEDDATDPEIPPLTDKKKPKKSGYLRRRRRRK